jgi:hypothetical protein
MRYFEKLNYSFKNSMEFSTLKFEMFDRFLSNPLKILLSLSSTVLNLARLAPAPPQWNKRTKASGPKLHPAPSNQSEENKQPTALYQYQTCVGCN